MGQRTPLLILLLLTATALFAGCSKRGMLDRTTYVELQDKRYAEFQQTKWYKDARNWVNKRSEAVDRVRLDKFNTALWVGKVQQVHIRDFDAHGVRQLVQLAEHTALIYAFEPEEDLDKELLDFTASRRTKLPRTPPKVGETWALAAHADDKGQWWIDAAKSVAP